MRMPAHLLSVFVCVPGAEEGGAAPGEGDRRLVWNLDQPRPDTLASARGAAHSASCHLSVTTTRHEHFFVCLPITIGAKQIWVRLQRQPQQTSSLVLALQALWCRRSGVRLTGQRLTQQPELLTACPVEFWQQCAQTCWLQVWPELAGYLMLIPAFQRRFVGFTSQLRIRYPSSALTTECAAEGVPAAPAAGWRAPDVLLQPCEAATPKAQDPETLDPQPVRLFKLLRGTRHTLLAFCEPSDVLAREAAALQARYVALLRVVCIGRGAAASSPDPDPASDPAPTEDAKRNGASVPNSDAHARAAVLHCVDADGSVHKRYGVTAPCAFLIRPDMYIGVARAPAGTLTTEVERRFA